MVVSDLDGTLLFREHGVSQSDIQTLRALGEQGIPRLIATGRAWWGVQRVLPSDFPIDYLVFSSGAGIVDWKSGKLLAHHNLSSEETEAATEVFLAHDLDFMVHDPIPHAQPFYFRKGSVLNPDFEHRLGLHPERARPWETRPPQSPASQVLAISPQGDPDLPYLSLRQQLPQLSVVRATSPLDGKSLWIEAFSPHASKSKGANWVASRLGIDPSEVLAIGNDYNDVDLLEWAGTSYVLDNAPASVRTQFANVPTHGYQGVSHAVQLWLSQKPRSRR